MILLSGDVQESETLSLGKGHLGIYHSYIISVWTNISFFWGGQWLFITRHRFYSGGLWYLWRLRWAADFSAGDRTAHGCNCWRSTRQLHCLGGGGKVRKKWFRIWTGNTRVERGDLNCAKKNGEEKMEKAYPLSYSSRVLNQGLPLWVEQTLVSHPISGWQQWLGQIEEIQPLNKPNEVPKISQDLALRVTSLATDCFGKTYTRRFHGLQLLPRQPCRIRPCWLRQGRLLPVNLKSFCRQRCHINSCQQPSLCYYTCYKLLLYTLVWQYVWHV